MRIGAFKGGPPPLRTMLIGLGVGRYDADMSIPYMFFLPTTTDPDAQGVMQIVAGLQNRLKSLGYVK